MIDGSEPPARPSTPAGSRTLIFPPDHRGDRRLGTDDRLEHARRFPVDGRFGRAPRSGGGLRGSRLRVGVPTFVQRVVDHPDRAAWNSALAASAMEHRPDLVVSAGFMKILGPRFLAGVGCPVLNTHPALLPSFPGVRGVADALAYGVKVTGATVHLVDDGVDTGPVLAQAAVPVEPGDTVATLHERIKIEERRLLVGTVAALARQGATVTGREVTIP